MLVLYNKLKLSHYRTQVRIKAADNLDALAAGNFFIDDYFAKNRRAAIALCTAMKKNRLEVRQHIARNFANSYAVSSAYRSHVQQEAIEILSEIGTEQDVEVAVSLLFGNCWISLQVYPFVCKILDKYAQKVDSKILIRILESKDSIISQSEHGTTTRSMTFDIKDLKFIAKNELLRRQKSSENIEEEMEEIMVSDSLSLVWPPTNISPDHPIMWLRNSEGNMLYLNLEEYSVVLLFVTEEAAQVVAIALKKLFNFTSEIRSVKGLSRSVFEKKLLQSGEFENVEGDLKIIWEDDPEFKSLLPSLEINIIET